MRILFVLLCSLTASIALAQESQNTILDFDTFMKLVKENHPLAQQAELMKQTGEATLLSAKGSMDPKAYYNWNGKNYDAKDYYRINDAGLRIPTWVGLDVYAGYEQNSGQFLNPENSTPATGLLYAGINLPVGQGLFIDERRAQIKKAQLFNEITVAERNMMYNDLLYDAGNAYWNWFTAYNNLRVYSEALEVADQRLQAVKQSALLGDRPDIDTLEAGIQVQDRLLGLQQANLDFLNATAQLEIFLWADGMIPLEIAPGTVPAESDKVSTESPDAVVIAMIDSLTINHPNLVQSRLKISQLEIEKRWRKEQLKPELNVKYNVLSSTVAGDVFTDISTNYARWGVDFSMPLFLRKERGALKLADLMIQDANLQLSNKNAELSYKITASLNKWQTSKQQADLYTRTVKDYQNLLEAERQLFNAGESSLFMVNARELGFINSQIKLNDLIAKNKLAELETNYSLAILPD